MFIVNVGDSGYHDIGSSWKEEEGIPYLEVAVDELYEKIKPLYRALHGFVRYKLRKFYGRSYISKFGPVPIHILGNLWGQNWASLIDLLYENHSIMNGTYKASQSIVDIVEKADHFYQAAGFIPLPEQFWKNSKFSNDLGNCHATSFNMFRFNDVRMAMCAANNEKEIQTVYHELGHIQYYLHYQNQPNIFKDGASSAMHECIGDAVALSMNNFGSGDIQNLLKIGLRLIPQLPFALALEKWRWLVFAERISPENYNKVFWNLKLHYQGVVPPVERTNSDFDAPSKYHIAMNIPYIRYFLATFCQVQVFETICKKPGNSTRADSELHSCEISHNSSKSLRKMMEYGSSIDFESAMLMSTGNKLQAEPFLRFFQPLLQWLETYNIDNDVPIGWDQP